MQNRKRTSANFNEPTSHLYDTGMVWLRRDWKSLGTTIQHLPAALHQCRRVHCGFVLGPRDSGPLPRYDRRVEFILQAPATAWMACAQSGKPQAGLIVRRAPSSLYQRPGEELDVQAVFGARDYEPGRDQT